MWFHQGDPEWGSDADVVGSMNATPLLTIFGPNLFQVGVQAHGLNKEFNIINLIQHQIDAERIGNKADIT
jgi:hypothetical protein